MGIQINGTNDTITTNDGTISIDGSTTLTGSLTGTTGTFSGDVGVAGTLTSEDKTNIDSVGLITARTGIKVGPITGVAATHYADGSIRTTGIITASSFVGDGSGLTGAGPTLANGSNDRLVTATGANALNGEANLTYNGNTFSQAISNAGNGMDVFGAGDHWTAYVGSSNRTAANVWVSKFAGQWNRNDIASIACMTGADTTNKDEGQLAFYTTPSGGSETERLRIDSSGEVLIGATARGREKGLHLAGANQDPGGVWTQMGIYSTDTQAANKGGSIGFGGQDGSLDKQQFAAIKGAKENGTSGNYAGYMSFYTRPNGNVTAERLRIGQNSNNSPVGSFGTGSSHLNNNTNPDRASFKVGGRLHVEGAFGHNAMCGLYYNCYSGGNDLFYGGTYTPSGGDGRASAITMRYGGVAILTDSSSTAYSPTTQITTMGTALSVGRDGYVTTPKNPCVSMSVSSSYKDSHYLQHSTVNTNIGSHYSTSTCIFTCPVAGLYFCSLMVMSNNNNDTMDFELHKNGGNMNSILVPYNAPTGGSYNQVTGQCILHCASGDELRFKRNNGSVYGGRHSNITFALIG